MAEAIDQVNDSVYHQLKVNAIVYLWPAPRFGALAMLLLHDSEDLAHDE